jgi:hypothetical protein
MVDQNDAMVPQGDWRPRVFVLGGLIGAVLGLLSAYLFVRATEEAGKDAPGTPATGDAVRLGASLLGIIRTIAEWGTR